MKARELMATTQKAAAAFGVQFQDLTDQMATVVAAYRKQHLKRTERLLEQARSLRF